MKKPIRSLNSLLNLGIALILSACGPTEIRPIEESSLTTNGPALLPLVDDQIISQSFFGNLENYYKFVESISYLESMESRTVIKSSEYETVDYFDPFALEVNQKITDDLLDMFDNNSIDVGQVIRYNQYGKVIEDTGSSTLFRSAPPQARTEIVLGDFYSMVTVDVRVASQNCSKSESIEMLDLSSDYLLEFVKNHYELIGNVSSARSMVYLLEKGQVLSFTVRGPNACIVKFLMLVQSVSIE